MNLTRQQENEAVSLLKRIVRKSQTMLPGVSLKLWDNFADHYFVSHWEELTLSRHGLRLESGYNDRCAEPGVCMTHHEDRVNSPRKLQPSARIVKKYRLSAGFLQKKLAKLIK